MWTLGIAFLLGPQAAFALGQGTSPFGPVLLLIKVWYFYLIKYLPQLISLLTVCFRSVTANAVSLAFNILECGRKSTFKNKVLKV